MSLRAVHLGACGLSCRWPGLLARPHRHRPCQPVAEIDSRLVVVTLAD